MFKRWGTIGVCIWWLSGCANVAGMAGEGIGGMVGNAMGSILDKPIEVADSVKKVAIIEGAK